MKTIILIAALAAALTSCGGRGGETTAAGKKSPPFAGSTRERVPAQVGRFKLTGEAKSLALAPPEQFKSEALRPTEGTTAQYEAADGSKLSLQVLNYPSPEDAERARQTLAENYRAMGGAAKVMESRQPAGPGGATRTLLSVEDAERGVRQVVWTESSLYYTVIAPSIDAATDFQKNFPF